MGEEIKVNGNGSGENAEELKKKQQAEQARAEQQGKEQVDSDLTSGLSGTKINNGNINSGIGAGGIFGASQMNVNEQELANLSNAFLGFTMNASQLSFGVGENMMSSSINSWFQAFMACFKGGNTSTDLSNIGGMGTGIGSGTALDGVKTTLIQPEEKPAAETKPEEESKPEVTAPKTETPATPAVDKKKEAEEAKKTAQAVADKKSLESDDLTTKNREQFLKWLDKKGYKSEIGNDTNLIDFVDANGNKNRVRFNEKGVPSLIYSKDSNTSIHYGKDGSKSITKVTKQDERYTYTESTSYNKNGVKTSYKKTERDAGNYFNREWVGASGVTNTDVEKRSYGLTKPIEGLQTKMEAPEFKSGNSGYSYDPQKGTLEGKDVVYTKLKDGGFEAKDKTTGASYHYDKDGKLTKEIDYSKGIIRDFKKDGSYDEHYKKEWVKN